MKICTFQTLVLYWIEWSTLCLGSSHCFLLDKRLGKEKNPQFCQ